MVSDAKRDWTTNGNQSNLFGLEPNFGCCTANMHQGWPKFAASLWMSTPDKGLAAVAYSPSEVRTEVNGIPVHIVEQTDFPFAEEITIHVDPGQPVTFPLKLRIPSWTSGMVVRVNGASQRDIKPRTFITISREWRAGDTVLLRIPMPVIVSHTNRGAVYVTRGPLLYSLAIGEKWKKIADKGETADWEVLPTTHWNFALVINKDNPQSSFTVSIRKMGSQPFSPEGTPIELHGKGVPLKDWKLADNSAGPLPESPVKTHGRAEDITLIPYGAAKLRITEFPEVQKQDSR